MNHNIFPLWIFIYFSCMLEPRLIISHHAFLFALLFFYFIITVEIAHLFYAYFVKFLLDLIIEIRKSLVQMHTNTQKQRGIILFWEQFLHFFAVFTADTYCNFV